MKNTTDATTEVVAEPTTEVVVAAMTDGDTSTTTEVVAPATTEAQDPAIAAAIALLEASGFRIRTASQIAASNASRSLMPKAEPDAVREYFESTGLNRKELAAAVGVTVSVIATVQNPKGDRWSAARFEAAKPLIEAVVAAKAAAAAEAAKVAAEATPEAPTETPAEAVAEAA